MLRILPLALAALAEAQARGDAGTIESLNRRMARVGRATAAAARRFGVATCGGG